MDLDIRSSFKTLSLARIQLGAGDRVISMLHFSWSWHVTTSGANNHVSLKGCLGRHMPWLNHYNPNPKAFPDQEPGEKNAGHQVDVCKITGVLEGPLTASVPEGCCKLHFN